MSSVVSSAIKFGTMPLAKSTYALLKAWAWADRVDQQFDHVLSYWGNYAATAAYVFHRLVGAGIPFSTFLHANIDLYRTPVFLRQKLLYVDNIIAVCDFNRKFLESRFPEIFPSIANKIHLHHLGLDVGKIPFTPDHRPPHRVIAVGRLVPQKGFDYLLRAVGELKRRAVAVTLDLIGDGTEASSLKQLAAELNVLDRVCFRGWLHSDDVLTAMRQATLLCHPSPDIGDAVPTVIKEAMAVGTPVIGSRVAGIPELLDDGRCGILVEPKDVRQLADAIERMLINEILRRDYAATARKRVEETFDLWKNGQKLAAILTRGKNEDALAKW